MTSSRFWRDRKSTRLKSTHFLHASLPIYLHFVGILAFGLDFEERDGGVFLAVDRLSDVDDIVAFLERSEEHTSEVHSLPARVSSDLPSLCWHTCLRARF